MDMNSLPLDHGSANRHSAIDRYFRGRDGDRTVNRRRPQDVTIKTKDYGIFCVAETRCILRNNVQHWLYVRWRASDDAQDFTGRGLLFQRLLELVEQPHVLKCDHGLVGEGFQKLDLRRREGAHLDATCVQ